MEYKLNDNELIYMIQEDEDYLTTLIGKYKPVVYRIANSYYNSCINLGVEFDDLIQECNIALYSACRSFNTNKNVRFSTYAIKCIENHMKVCYRNMNTQKNKLLNNSLSIDVIGYDGTYNFKYKNYEEDFIKMKNLFDINDSVVFELRYNGFTYNEISKLLDIPLSTVDGRLCKIRTILRKQLVFFLLLNYI